MSYVAALMSAVSREVARKEVEVLDLVQFRDILSELFAKGQRDPMLDVVQALLKQCKDLIVDQALEIASLRKQLFGRKSERVALDQLSLFPLLLAAALAQSAECTDPTEEAKKPDEGSTADDDKTSDDKTPDDKPPRKKRKPLEPTRSETIAVPEDERPCPSCGGDRTCMGHTTGLVVEYTPPTIEIIEYRREKLVCRPCDGEITVAPNPVTRPVEGALPGPRMLATLVINKVVDGLPLHRTRRMFGRLGQELPIQTLNRWEDYGHELVGPLIRQLARLVHAADIINLDDTGLRVRDPEHDHGIRNGHIWTFVGRKFDPEGDLGKTQTFITYMYAPTWEAMHPRAYLAPCRALLQGDAYRGYEPIATMDDGAIKNKLAGCMMHARRPFVAAMEAGDPGAFFFIEKFQRIYEFEALAKKERLTAAQRLELRAKQSVPLLKEMRARLEDLDPLPLLKPMRKGVRYMLNQWDKLMIAFEVDGRLEIDNGEAERRLRRVASGRKSWLFAGSERGAARFADMLSIVASAEAVGLEPGRYLAEIFEHLPAGPQSDADYLRFLPHLWGQRQQLPQ